MRRPGFTVVAILTLALGIGANTAIFSVTHAVLLKPLRQRPRPLVIVNENNLSRGWTSFSVSPSNFLDWRAQSQSFASIAAYSSRAPRTTRGRARRASPGSPATAGFYEMLDAKPVAGRLFRPEEFEPGGNLVVLLGHGFWQRAFGGKPPS